MRLVIFTAILAFASIAVAEEPRLVVSGTGTVTAETDEGYITVGVTIVKPTSSEALKANTESMRLLYGRLEQFGVSTKNIKTIDFSVGEHYTTVETGGKDNNGNPLLKNVKDGYAVSNAIRITVCELPKFGDILDAVIQDGATQVQNISFGSSKASENLDEARALAVKDALKKSKILSDGLGVALGPVVSVSEGAGPQPRVYYAAAAAMSDSAPGAPPISGGTLTFSVSVNVQWSLSGVALRVKDPAVIQLPPITIQPRDRDRK